jgi:FkbM family methyltransferase
MVNLKERIASFVNKTLGRPEPLHEYVLFGKPIMLRKSSVRIKPDYDDAWVLACGSRARNIFDIGASTGYDSLIILLNNPGCTITLIEANPEALVIACDNLVRNHLSDRARFIPAFVGREDDRHVHLWTVGTGQAGSKFRSHAVSAARAGLSINAPTIRLDTLCEKAGNVPDFVKIDVEGAEYEVLEGAKQSAALKNTRFLIEMHSNPELSMLENAKLVLKWADEMAYDCWYLYEHLKLEKPEVIAQRGRCHILLQPEQWAYPAWLKNISQSDPIEKALVHT